MTFNASLKMRSKNLLGKLRHYLAVLCMETKNQPATGVLCDSRILMITLKHREYEMWHKNYITSSKAR